EVADRLSPAEAEGLPRAFVKYGFQIVTSVLITFVIFDFLFHLLQVRIRTALPASNQPSLWRIWNPPGTSELPGLAFWCGTVAALLLILYTLWIIGWGPVKTRLENQLPRIKKPVEELERRGWLRTGVPLTLPLVQLFVTPFL